MPVLKHAKKKLRQDKKRTADNLAIKQLYKKLIKDAKATKTPEAMSKAYQAIDKAAKKFVLHNNKAARLKSQLAKVVAGTSTTQAPGKQKTAKAKSTKAKAVRKSSKAARAASSKK
jgi:small subunit ribosomal protein S20